VPQNSKLHLASYLKSGRKNLFLQQIEPGFLAVARGVLDCAGIEDKKLLTPPALSQIVDVLS
jgi:hypothetical protein